jgi:hypothetical protein
MVLDLDGPPFDLNALYRGAVVSLTPRLGAVIEGQGALIQGAWGSGREGYGVLKVVAKTPEDILQAESLDVDARGMILVGGAGVTEEALRHAESLQAQGIIVGGLEARLLELAKKMELPIIVTEGFGHVPISQPIFELLSQCNGQDAAVNSATRMRGGALRPEIFIPLVSSRLSERGAPRELTSLSVQPGSKVRVIREPYLGRTGRLPQELLIKWSSDESGARQPSVEVELDDARGTARAIIPWTNLELIG